MKKGKSPGADWLPVEILQAGGECVEKTASEDLQ